MEERQDLISRQAAIDGKISIQRTNGVEMYSDEAVQVEYLKALPSAQPDNQVNLCDSCTYQYPDCPSKPDDVIFGNGKGNDNICACNKYKPSAQQEPKSPLYYGDGYSEGKMVYDSAECPNCGYIYDEGDQVWGEPYCPHCGQALDWYMRGEQDEID